MILISAKRTNLGDPVFVKGLDEYEHDMLEDSTVRKIRKKISDLRTQNVSAYDPDGFESLDTLVARKPYVSYHTNCL